MDAKHFIKLNSKAEQSRAESGEGKGGEGIGCEAAKLVIRNRIENMGEISERKVLACHTGGGGRGVTYDADDDCRLCL